MGQSLSSGATNSPSTAPKVVPERKSSQLTDSDLVDSFEFDLAGLLEEDTQETPKTLVRTYLNRNASESFNSSLVRKEKKTQ